jgi:hypothetical protein
MKIFQSSSATEWRTKVAHGETVGFNSKMDKAPDGAKEMFRGLVFCRPCRGLFCSVVLPTVSLWATFVRASGATATQFAVAAMIFFAVGATAQTTNDLSTNRVPSINDNGFTPIDSVSIQQFEAENQGRQLAQQLCEQKPATNFMQAGILQIHGSNKIDLPIEFQAHLNANDWYATYEMTSGSNRVKLVIAHEMEKPNRYVLLQGLPAKGQAFSIIGTDLSLSKTMEPFVGSDFWVCDLGLEFFHWPAQKVLKKEFRRQCACTVLESTNPNPSANGYSRVVSWIDEKTLGIVEAYAYDANGKLLKDFYPKDFKKVGGQWQVGMMEMDNVQTGSRSRIEFDLDKE